MVRCLNNTQIDLAKWDACIQNSKIADAYGFSCFLNSICDGWIGLILDDYLAVMPLVYSNKLGVNYIYQPAFFQRTGIYSKTELNETTITSFYAAIPKTYKLQEFAINENCVPPKEFAYQVTERPNLILHLNKPYEELKSQYNSNTKRKLKKAREFNLQIKTSLDPSAMIEAYSENRGKTNALSSKNILHLNQLIKNALAKSNGVVLEAYTESNEFAGGIFILTIRNRNILLFMGANSKAKQTGALNILIDHFLEAKARTDEVFDFEGSSDPGVAQFYKGFGGREEKYYSLEKDELYKLIRFAKKIKG